MNNNQKAFYSRLVSEIAEHFGSSTEVVLHDLTADDPSQCIVAIANGVVSGRKPGDGPSEVVIAALKNKDQPLEDRISYLTKTSTGKILKSSTIYIRDDNGKVIGILGINTDISLTMALEKQLHDFHTPEPGNEEPVAITAHISDLLDSLIQQGIQLVGKPAALMSKDEKIKAVRFLNDRGAFLITKSGPRVCSVFGISKYTLYSYLDEIKAEQP